MKPSADQRVTDQRVTFGFGSGKQHGFTLTELLIVLLIIGIPFFIFFIKEVGVTEGYRFAAPYH